MANMAIDKLICGLRLSAAQQNAEDAVRAQRAVGILASRPEQSLPLLQHHVRPVPRVDAKRLGRIFTDPGSDEFKIRAQAHKELEMLGEAAAPALSRAAETSDVVEVRNRCKQLLEKLDNVHLRLSRMRMLQLLEQSSSPAARQILCALADGATGAWLTQEGSAAWKRVANRLEAKSEPAQRDEAK